MIGQFGNFGEGDYIYTVQAGDSLSAISKKFYGDMTHVQEIADANGITNVNLISVGQRLTLPGVQSGAKVIPIVPLPMPPPTNVDPITGQPIYVAPPAWPTPRPPSTPIIAPQPAPIQVPGIGVPGQPGTVPGFPAPQPQPTPPAAVDPNAPRKSVSLFSFLPQSKDFLKKQYLGVAVWQWATILALAGVGLGMLGSASPATAKNPRKKKRK